MEAVKAMEGERGAEEEVRDVYSRCNIKISLN
jgi:hypothetical protein